MAVRTIVSLTFLCGPSLYLLLMYFREYGFRIGRDSGWGVFPALAIILLLGHVFDTVSGRLGEILAADFFPVRGYLFFAVSGAAYGAAIFPHLLAEDRAVFGKSNGFKHTQLIAIPAWIWLSVLIILAVFQYAS